MMIFTNYCCTIQRILGCYPKNEYNMVENITTKKPSTCNYVNNQCMPSKVLIPENERANHPTRDIYLMSPSTMCAPDTPHPYRDVRSLLVTATGLKSSRWTSQCVFKGSSRIPITLMFRLATHSARIRTCLRMVVVSVYLYTASADWRNLQFFTSHLPRINNGTCTLYH